MKKLILASSLLASSAMAHEGIHSHPHNIESIYAIAACIIVAITYGAWTFWKSKNVQKDN